MVTRPHAAWGKGAAVARPTVNAGIAEAAAVRLVGTPGHTTWHPLRRGRLVVRHRRRAYPSADLVPASGVARAGHGQTAPLPPAKLLDRLATDQTQIIGAHLPFPGNGVRRAQRRRLSLRRRLSNPADLERARPARPMARLCGSRLYISVARLDELVLRNGFGLMVDRAQFTMAGVPKLALDFLLRPATMTSRSIPVPSSP